MHSTVVLSYHVPPNKPKFHTGGSLRWENPRCSLSFPFSLRRWYLFSVQPPVPAFLFNVYVLSLSRREKNKKTIADLKAHGCAETLAYQTCFRHFVRLIRVLLNVITQRETTFGPGCSGNAIKGWTDGAHEFLRYRRTIIGINLRAIILLHSAVAPGSNLSGNLSPKLASVNSFPGKWQLVFAAQMDSCKR